MVLYRISYVVPLTVVVDAVALTVLGHVVPLTVLGEQTILLELVRSNRLHMVSVLPSSTGQALGFRQ